MRTAVLVGLFDGTWSHRGDATIPRRTATAERGQISELFYLSCFQSSDSVSYHLTSPGAQVKWDLGNIVYRCQPH